MRLLLPVGGVFVLVTLSSAAQPAQAVLPIPCAADPMPVYRPDLPHVERMPVLRVDTVKLEKMPVARAACSVDIRRTPYDSAPRLPRLLP